MEPEGSFSSVNVPTPAQRVDDMPIVEKMRAVCHKLRLQGKVYAFGSYASGFKTAKSDCDLVYLSAADESHEPVDVLKRMESVMMDFGFHTVVRVFQARVPLIKAVLDCEVENEESQTQATQTVDVDICVDNILGFHNTRLMGAYHQLDTRVRSVGVLVKQWARSYELLNSSDGFMNSYAWTLLTIFYLMNTDPPVVPNLQDLADKEVIVKDTRWGIVSECHCEFWAETHGIPKSRNTQTIWQLLYGFLRYYSTFEWDLHCVSIRLALTDRAIVFPTTSSLEAAPQRRILKTSVICGEEAWCVEDPFDLRHNLAANSTVQGRKIMLDAIEATLTNFDAVLRKSAERSVAIERAFHQWCPADAQPKGWYMKCRVNLDTIASKAFLDAFSDVTNVVKCYFPKPSADRLRWDAFLEFAEEIWRKKAHTRNETVVNGWQLRLLNCSFHCIPSHTESLHLYEVIEPENKLSLADVSTTDAATVKTDTVKSVASANGSAESVKSIEIPTSQAESPMAASIASLPMVDSPPPHNKPQPSSPRSPLVLNEEEPLRQFQ